LRTSILNNGLSADQKKLLDKIIPATAMLAIAEAIPYRLVNFTPDGLVTNTIKGNVENVDVSTEGDQRRLQSIMNVTLAKGLSELARLTKWLNANAGLFTGYIATDQTVASKINDANGGVYLA
jgi:hypothetical protein